MLYIRQPSLLAEWDGRPGIYIIASRIGVIIAIDGSRVLLAELGSLGSATPTLLRQPDA